MGEMLKLSDAARIVVRPGPAIQFGVDATRSGVVDSIAPQQVGGVVKALAAARGGLPAGQIRSLLTRGGLSELAAQSLLHELTEYGILQVLPRTQPRVAVLGRGPLATAISELLEASGCTVRRPLRGETDSKFLRMLSGEVPLVAVDKLAHARPLAPAVRNGLRTVFLPVQLIDGHGLVGPVANWSSGPCPLCTQLHRTDVDPAWPQLLTQLPGSSPAGAPVTIAATAAQATAIVLQVVGLDSPALGTAKREWIPGTMVQVEPFSGGREFVVEQHRHCPLCFESKHLQEGLTIGRDLDWANA